MVYCAHFQLERMPFESTPDARFVFMSPEHEEALAALQYGVVERRGLTVLTGSAGSGKTLMSRALVDSLGGGVHSVHVSNPPQCGRDLVTTVCRELGVRFRQTHSTGELLYRLRVALHSDFDADGTVVAILDDAHKYSLEALEHVLLLCNLETSTAKLLQIVLLGQAELCESLCDPQLERLRQRIYCNCEVGPLPRERVRHYVRHRLKCAGAKGRRIFTDQAVELIAERSRGVPRVINQLADNALLVAFSGSREQVDRATVAEVIQNMMSLQFRGNSRWGFGGGTGRGLTHTTRTGEKLVGRSSEIQRDAEAGLRSSPGQGDDKLDTAQEPSGRAPDESAVREEGMANAKSWSASNRRPDGRLSTTIAFADDHDRMREGPIHGLRAQLRTTGKRVSRELEELQQSLFRTRSWRP